MTIFARFFNDLTNLSIPDLNALSEFNSEALLFFAEWSLFENDKPSAKKVYQQLAQNNEYNAICQSALFLIDGNPQGAYRAIGSANNDEIYDVSLCHKARALLNLGDPTNAINALKAAIQCNQDNVFALGYLAFVQRAISDLKASTENYERVLSRYPSSVTANFNLGLNYNLVDKNVEAAKLFRRTIELDNDHYDAHLNYGLVCHTLGDLEAAENAFHFCERINSDNPLLMLYLGTLANEKQNNQQAHKYLSKAVQLDPNLVDAFIELANLFEKNNQLDAMEQMVTRAQKIDPENPRVLFEQAKLDGKRKDFDKAIYILSKLESMTIAPRIKTESLYTKARFLDGAGKYKDAFNYFESANSSNKDDPRRVNIDPQSLKQKLICLSQWRPANSQTSLTNQEYEPVFLMGMPRSGTTLLDTFLDAHPQIKTIEEKPTFETAMSMAKVTLKGFIENGCDLSEDTKKFIANHYEANIKELTEAEPNQVVIDKLPLRFIDLPIIHNVFPNAKYIFVYRHPFDVVLSNFMQHFHPTEAFIHFDSLNESANTYTELMESWLSIQQHVSGRAYNVYYEKLIDDAQTQLSELMAFLTIPYDESMTKERMKKRGRVSTNSYDQVNQPLYRSSVERWRNYDFAFENVPERLIDLKNKLGY